MKTFALTLSILLISLVAGATSPALPPPAATLEGSKNGILRVELSARGTLSIRYEGSRPNKIIQLNPTLANDLLAKARELGHVEIEQTINPTVCEIAPAPRLEHLKVSQYSYEFNTYHGPMKSVYIKDFCSNPIFISPKYDKQIAMELQTALETLALQGK